MKNGPFEDVFPIENGDIPASYVSLPEGNWKLLIQSESCAKLYPAPMRPWLELVWMVVQAGTPGTPPPKKLAERFRSVKSSDFIGIHFWEWNMLVLND